MNHPTNIFGRFLMLAFTLAGSANALEPIDRPEYTVYISSPLEQWSGNESELKAAAQGHARRETSYRMWIGNKHFVLGHPTVLQGPSSHPIIQASNAKLAEAGFSIPRESRNFFQIEQPFTISATDVAAVFSSQADLRKRTIIRQGDPDTLSDRVASKKFFGAVASLGAMFFAADKFGGLSGAQHALNLGVPQDLYGAVARWGTFIAPVSPNVVVPEGIAHIDISRVTSREQDRVGQLLILYKVPKTEQVEAAALQDAVVGLAGALQTPEQIQEARAKDLAERRQIWRECVESEQCKK